MTSDYARYLTAKSSVDDRALNRRVLADLRGMLETDELRVVELGAGAGTMVTRLLDWHVVDHGDFTLVDVDADLLDHARDLLARWATARSLPVRQRPDGVRLGEVDVHLVPSELGDYLRSAAPERFDLLIANALLDVVDVPSVLPDLLHLLTPRGTYWFTITYDGECSFQPEHPLDRDVLTAYHQDMDERTRYGHPAGESRAGRHLITHLRDAGAPATSVGSSDWIVFAGPTGDYPHDEAHFLACILHTIESALRERMAENELAEWVAARTGQLATGELVYVAHQLDMAGRAPIDPGRERGDHAHDLA